MPLDPASVEKMAHEITGAWNSGSADAVASFYADDAEVVINRGEPWRNRDGIVALAEGFFADVGDLILTFDDIRISGHHAIYVWTFAGRHSGSGNALNVRGWEEWELTDDLKVKSSRGWFDADTYARQVEGG